jgi:hypothetical protein
VWARRCSTNIASVVATPRKIEFVVSANSRMLARCTSNGVGVSAKAVNAGTNRSSGGSS